MRRPMGSESGVTLTPASCPRFSHSQNGDNEMDTLLSILTDNAVLTAIGIVLSLFGVPVWVTKIIAVAAPVAVNMVEQTMGDKSGAEKKAAAVKAVRALIPAVVSALPGTSGRIHRAVEAAVFTETE